VTCAGVPRATLVILLATATSFNLPIEPIFIVLGIDELMDMARTSVNVIGNCLATGHGPLGRRIRQSPPLRSRLRIHLLLNFWECHPACPDPAIAGRGERSVVILSEAKDPSSITKSPFTQSLNLF
jgi:hypothetical protein